MKCLNTVVFYENRDEVKAYVKEAASLFSGLLDIIVVVNSDRDRQVPKLAEEWKAEGIAGVHVIDYGDNVGYLNALLKPVQSVDLGAYDYYILSNTDIHWIFFKSFSRQNTLQTWVVSRLLYTHP